MRQEIRRQFLHFLFGSIFIALVIIAGVQQTILIAGGALLLGIFASYLIKRGIRLPFLSLLVENVERKHEAILPGKGALVFFLGAVILMVLFKEPAIIVGALCVSVYGDAASTIIGINFGKHKISGPKTMEGTIGGIFVSTAALLLLFEWPIALTASTVGMLAELLPGDDSLTIPLVTAIILTLL